MQPIQRSKAVLVAAVLLVAGTLGVIFAGSALGADWRDYSGEVHAGNAYLLTVPAETETLEISVVDVAEAGAAKVALFDPANEKLGYYTLDATWPSMSISAPAAGDYVLFVYEVKDATLKARVLSSNEGDFELKALELSREDRFLGTFRAGADLRQQFTVKLTEEPAFATLLYKGSVSGLTASLSTTKGSVLEIIDESGSAMSPGVYTTDVTGVRSIAPENLAAGAYVAKVDADSFDGSLYLTVLTFTRELPEETPEAPDVPSEPVDPVLPENLAELGTGRAYAVMVPEGATGLMFEVAEAFESVHDHEEADSNESDDNETDDGHATPWGGHEDVDDCDYYGYGYSLVTIVSPEDEIVAVVEVNGWDEEFTFFEFNGTGAGEYILYPHGDRENKVIMAILGEDDVMPEVREVATVVNVTSLGRVMSLTPTYGEATFESETPILELGFGLLDNLVSTNVNAWFVNGDEEQVAAYNNMVATGPSEWMFWGYQFVDFSLLNGGKYTVTYDALQMSAEPYYTFLTYDRDAPVEAPEVPEEGEEEQEADEGDEGESNKDVVTTIVGIPAGILGQIK